MSKVIISKQNFIKFLHNFESQFHLFNDALTFLWLLTQITFQILVRVLMSVEPGEDMEFLKREFMEVIKGLICLPIKLPGFRMYKSLQVINSFIINSIPNLSGSVTLKYCRLKKEC